MACPLRRRRRFDPRTVSLTFRSEPSGLDIAVNSEGGTTPFHLDRDRRFRQHDQRAVTPDARRHHLYVRELVRRRGRDPCCLRPRFRDLYRHVRGRPTDRERLCGNRARGRSGGVLAARGVERHDGGRCQPAQYRHLRRRVYPRSGRRPQRRSEHGSPAERLVRRGQRARCERPRSRQRAADLRALGEARRFGHLLPDALQQALAGQHLLLQQQARVR